MGRRKIRSLNMMNWPLSYKLAVMLAIPFLAAAVLGTLRVSMQLDESRRFGELSGQVAVIPALFDFSDAALSTATLARLGLPPNVEAEHFIESRENVRNLVAAGNFDPKITENLAQLLEDGQVLYDTADDLEVSAEDFGRRTIDFVVRYEATFRTLLDLTENTEVLTAGTNMLNAFIAQRTMIDQANALGSLGGDADSTQTMARNAMNIEQSTLGLLRGTSLDTGRIDDMLGNIDTRKSLIVDFAAGPEGVDALYRSLLDAFETYRAMTEASTAQLTATLDRLTSDARSAAVRDTISVVAILAVALVVALLVARALSVPLRRLRDGALNSARHELPAAIAAVKEGADVSAVELAPIDVHTDEEIGELARAVDSMNSAALRLAGEQAHLRQQVSMMLETLARRNKALVEQQLSLIDTLEYEEKDPARLQSLFSLDHLAARMRRIGDSLLVLSGTRPLTRNAPAPLGDVLRGAVSQVENYQRVRSGYTPHGYLDGTAVADVVHMIAELVDNALRASPSNSTVNFEFSEAVDDGLLLEISDCGRGTSPELLDEINARLAAGDDAETTAPRQMGLFVVGRLAARNGMGVRLRPTFDSETYAGITASVYFPASLLIDVNPVGHTQVTERPRRLPISDDPPRHVEAVSGTQGHPWF